MTNHNFRAVAKAAMARRRQTKSNYSNIKQNKTKFDLAERTFVFAKKALQICKKLPRETLNFNLVNQLSRSSTSIGANYLEANDALGKKSFLLSLRIARKETKETIYWLKLVNETNPKFVSEIEKLINEATELRNILSAIINKCL